MARVTAIFDLIDRMSGKLDRIERKARGTERALKDNMSATERFEKAQQLVEDAERRRVKLAERYSKVQKEARSADKGRREELEKLLKTLAREGKALRELSDAAADAEGNLWKVNDRGTGTVRMLARLNRATRGGGLEFKWRPQSNIGDVASTARQLQAERRELDQLINRWDSYAQKRNAIERASDIAAQEGEIGIRMKSRANQMAREINRARGITDPDFAITGNDIMPMMEQQRKAWLQGMFGGAVAGRAGRGGGGRRGDGRPPGLSGIGDLGGDIYSTIRGRRGLLGGFSGFAVLTATGLLSELSTAIVSLGAAVTTVIPMLSALGAGLAGLGAVGVGALTSVGVGAAIGIPALIGVQSKYEAVTSAVDSVNSATTPEGRTEALKALGEATQALSREEWRLVASGKALKSAWQEMAGPLQNDMIGFFANAADTARQLIPVFEPFIAQMNATNISIGNRALSAMSDPRQLELTLRMLEPFPRLAEKSATSLGRLAVILRGLIIAATPLGEWILDGMNGALGRLADTASSDEGLRRWQQGLDSMRPILSSMWNLLTAVKDAWVTLTIAAAPLAEWLLDSIASQLDRIGGADVTALTTNFRDQTRHLEALGRLLEGVIVSLWQLAQIGSEYLDPIVDALTDHLLPALVRIADVFTEEIGPVIPGLVAEFSELATFISEGIAPAVGFMARSVEALMAAFNSMPDWMKQLLVLAVGGGIAAKKITGKNPLAMIPGLDKLFGDRPKGTATDPIFTLDMASIKGGPAGLKDWMKRLPGAAGLGKLARSAAPSILKALGIAGTGIIAWDAFRGQAGQKGPYELQNETYRQVEEKLRGRDVSPAQRALAKNEALIEAMQASGWDTSDTSTLPGKMYDKALRDRDMLRGVVGQQMPMQEAFLNRINRFEDALQQVNPRYKRNEWEGARSWIISQLKSQALNLFTTQDWSPEQTAAALAALAESTNRWSKGKQSRHGIAEMPRFRFGGITSGPSIAGEAGRPEAIIPMDPTKRGLDVLLAAIGAYSSRGIKPVSSARLTPTVHNGGQGQKGRPEKVTVFRIENLTVEANEPQELLSQLEAEVRRAAFMLPDDDVEGVYA